MTTEIPHANTLIHASTMAMKLDKPILFDYYLESTRGQVFIGRATDKENILVKISGEEYTSPIRNISHVEHDRGGDYIIETENSLYLTRAGLEVRQVA